MTTISNLGVGSGLDLGSLLTSLTKAESAPLAAIQQQQASYTSKLSAYGQLNGAISALQTAAAALAKPALFQGVTASSTATDVLTATALSSAQSGTYAVNVTQLSQAQSLAAAGMTSMTTAIGAGAATTVTLDFGTISSGTLDPATGKYTGASFTADTTRAATSFTIDASNNTLAGIRDAINNSTAMGVTASIVNDGSTTPNRLVLTSKQTGETSSMRIVVDGDTALTSLLANNPAGLPATQNLQQTTLAQNTKLTLNGIAVTSATNTVPGAVQDVTMTVAKLGASTLSVKSDTASAETAVAAFVTAYNSLQSIATKLTAFDPASKSGATLLGDATLRSIQTRIRSVLTTAQASDSSGLTVLSQIGLSVQKDGALAVDSTKLTTALSSKLSGVAHLFSGTPGVGGYGTELSSLLTGFTDTNGTLTSATKGMTKSLAELGKQYEITSERIDATIARYKAQFTKLDVMISSMNQTSSYLTQQFDALNNSSNK
jgi:flagellar hook-associated protein 2